MLHIQNLHKSFGGVKAVNGCSFEIEKGTITAIIGPNGAGKSTVFNLISGIIKAGSGKIILDGQDITNLSIEKISNMGISRILQHSNLFSNLTVEENLLLAINNQDTKFWKNLFLGKKPQHQEYPQILKKLGIESHKNSMAKDLSFGQKRLVEIARAVLNAHKLIILDEPVAGVNPVLREKIQKILLDLKKQGETILLIEHDTNFTLSISDKIIVIDEGKVVAEGNPEKIRGNLEVVKAYLE